MRRGFHGLVLIGLGLTAACAHSRLSSLPRARTLTAPQIDSLWDRAAQLAAAKKWSEAGVAFERVLLELPFGDARIALAHYRLGESYFGEKENLLAVREFRLVADGYPADTLAPLALVRAGDAYAALWTRPELDASDGLSAMSVYQEMVTRYPGSGYVARADSSISRLEDKFARKMLNTADYYIRYKAWDSAIISLRDIIATYPKTSVMPEVLTRLIGAYRVLEYKADVLEACAYFRANFPHAPKLDTTCPAGPGAKNGGP